MTQPRPATDPPPHLGPSQDDGARRDHFDTQELVAVLSHYDLGIIESIREYPRGSRRAPKVRVRSRRGEFLLKRRAPGRDNPYRVAFAHHIQLHLGAQGFPVPRLIGTREDNNSMVQRDDRVYEMFEFVKGRHYDQSVEGAAESGRVLAAMHAALASHRCPYDAPRGSFHGVAGTEGALAMIPAAVPAVEPLVDVERLRAQCEFLRHAYVDAASRVVRLGYADRTLLLVHGDWHPGNLIYHGERVVAVLDFDSARLEPRMSDVANGSLQFSMVIGAPGAPETWPEGLSAERLRAFVKAYDDAARERLSRDELESLSWLIIEALIAESVTPIAATGSFARIPGSTFLTMIEKKVRWIQPRAEKLVEFVRR
jgi:homoserine kinase type II